jgi:hypothetical protein
MTENEKRVQDGEDAQDDLELREEDSAGVVGGDAATVAYKPQKADGSLDAGVHFKYDLKAQKEA